MVEHVKAPLKAMIGPWAHSWPHDGYPKPHVEWRHEAVRWFDQWLKGRDTGIVITSYSIHYTKLYEAAIPETPRS